MSARTHWVAQPRRFCTGTTLIFIHSSSSTAAAAVAPETTTGPPFATIRGSPAAREAVNARSQERAGILERPWGHPNIMSWDKNKTKDYKSSIAAPGVRGHYRKNSQTSRAKSPGGNPLWTRLISDHTKRGQGREAVKLYKEMREEGMIPSTYTFIAALKACSAITDLETGKEIHAHVIESGNESDIFVTTTLVDMYVKCGSMMDAHQVFENMLHRDVVSWTVMIMGYAQMEEGELALKLYTHMQHEGFLPNDRTFVAALKACSSLATQEGGKEVDGELIKIGSLEKGRAIHSQVAKCGFESDVFVATTLVDMYAKCGSMVDARQVFDKMLYRNVVSWNAMIMGYAHMQMGELALQLYACMQHEGFTPNDSTFVAALKACGSLASLRTGKEIHAEIHRVGLEGEGFIANCLVDMYGKCGSMLDAQRLFDAVPVKDVVTWSALIAGYGGQGDSERVFDLFERMQLEGIQPVGVTFVSILSVCSHTGLVEKGQKYFHLMCLKYGIFPNSEHYTCMVDLLGRAGWLDEAVAILKKMPFEPVVLTWMTILGACQKWNNVEIGRHAFICAVRLDGECSAAYASMKNIWGSRFCPLVGEC